MKHMRLLPVLLAIGLLLTGCGTPTADIESDAFDRLNLTVENSENPIQITVEGNPHFEGSVDTINASEITSTGKEIISAVRRCSDFDLCFDGTYEVSAPQVKEGRYILTTTGIQKAEEVTLGVNFYDLIMEASAKTVSSVKVGYMDSVELTGVSGSFEIFVFVLSEHMNWDIGPRRFTITGAVNDCSTLLLQWKSDHFELSSNVPVKKLSVVSTKTDGTVLFTSMAVEKKEHYTLHNANGYYTVD